MSGFQVATGFAGLLGGLRIRGTAGPLAAAAGFILLVVGAATQAATFNVNTFVDEPDANPGDGICETATGNKSCTLRAAIQEANQLPGADIIILQAGIVYALGRAGQDDAAEVGDLDILDSVSIIGAGPSSTIIDGNSAVTQDRVFDVWKCRGGPAAPSDCDDQHPPIVVGISGVTIQHGNASVTIGGGAIRNGGSLTLTNCLVTNNVASGLNGYGGGIFGGGSLNITNSTISGNSAGPNNAYGGGIYAAGTTTISGSTISGNMSSGPAGGLLSNGMTTITNSTISGNTASGSGGGLYGTVELIGSTISGNVAHGKGGGANTYSSTFINSTVSGNFSDDDGGGIYATGGTTQLYHVTVTLNQANADESGTAVAGGVYNASAGVFSAADSIIALNEVAIPSDPFSIIDTDDCAGNIVSVGMSILYDIKPVHCTVGGTYQLTDPKLGPLQNNGGSTNTHALLDGSPAIDKGVAAACVDDLGHPLASDQRGAHRTVGAQCDIGAFEVQIDPIFKSGFEP